MPVRTKINFIKSLKVRLVITAFLVAFSVSIALAQTEGIYSYSINSDGFSPKILALKKYSKGYLLAGTSNGLYRFDGAEFSPFYISDTIKEKSVTAIAEDKNSTIWLGFKNGEIGFVKNNKVELLKAEEGHPAVAITSILADSISDNIYFSTAGEGVYYYHAKRFYNINIDDGLSDNYVYEMTITKGGLVACTDRGLNTINIKNGKKLISKYTSLNGLPDNIVMSLYKRTNNKGQLLNECWLGMQDKGIALYAPGSSKTLTYNNTWKYGQVNSLITSDGELWAATEDKGIVKLNYDNNDTSNLFTVTGVTPGFPKAKNLLQDEEGNIWFTSNGQLVKTRGAQLQTILPFKRELYEQVHTILADSKQQIWININKGLRKFYYNKTNATWNSKDYKVAQINAKADITSLYEDMFGNIWVGTMGKGIVVIDAATGKSRSITENRLLVNGSVLSISGKGEEIWISSLAGAVHCNLTDDNNDIFNPYTFINFSSVSSLGSNYIYSVLVDSKKRVWFATDGRGLTVYENGRFRNYNEHNGIKSPVIYNLCEDKLGNIWFSALNNGVYKFDGNKFINFSTNEGLNDVTITALSVDIEGNIIAVSKKGINIINPNSNTISYFDANQGINEVNTDPNCITASGNAVYFVTNEGIVRYIPTHTSLKPRIVLEKVQLFMNDIDISNKGKFSYDENNFSFSFTGISFSHPEKVRYQYKLEGLSNEWITTKDNNINFPKLMPGTYRFVIRVALNNQFEGSPEASYAFVINKPFWFQLWFIILVILLLAAALYLYIKAREKRVKRLDLIEKEKIQSQFETLKSQVNPHFLFNSFNTLISVIEESPERAVEYVEHLSDLYRKIVTYRDKDIISLQEEIGLIHDYFFIQKKRFGNNLQFEINVTDDQLNLYKIAPLTLQLLCENAVKHNTVSSQNPLLITIQIQGETLIVSNNINPKLTVEKGAGMGLQNIQNRYRLLNQKEIKIDKNEQFFIVYIPLLYNK